MSEVEPRLKSPKPKKKRRSWPSPAEMGREVCEANVAHPCTGRATESHHIVLRSRGGSDDPSNLLACCTNCHRSIHANPVTATALGFMRHSWDSQPASVSVARRQQDGGSSPSKA